MKILIVEDDEEKSRQIAEFLRAQRSEMSIVNARSVDSGLRRLVYDWKSFSLLLLDMSMPSYDLTAEDPAGGVFESFGGEDLLAQMKLRGIFVPTIVITMFDSFGDKPKKMSLAELDRRLAAKFAPSYIGIVHYSASHEGWKRLLVATIEKIRG